MFNLILANISNASLYLQKNKEWKDYSFFLYKYAIMFKVILSSLVGTSLMTIFSYWKAYKEKEQFEEPVMLAKLMRRSTSLPIRPVYSNTLGWLLHFSIGYLFVVIYKLIWSNTSIRPGVTSGLLLGIPSGVIALLFWYTVLKLHPRAPQTHLKAHLQQLFLAHLVFGSSAGFTYRNLSSCE